MFLKAFLLKLTCLANASIVGLRSIFIGRKFIKEDADKELLLVSREFVTAFSSDEAAGEDRKSFCEESRALVF